MYVLDCGQGPGFKSWQRYLLFFENSELSGAILFAPTPDNKNQNWAQNWGSKSLFKWVFSDLQQIFFISVSGTLVNLLSCLSFVSIQIFQVFRYLPIIPLVKYFPDLVNMLSCQNECGLTWNPHKFLFQAE